MIAVNCPQNSYNPRNVIDIYRRHVLSGFNCLLHRGRMARLLEGFVLTDVRRKCYVKSPN